MSTIEADYLIVGAGAMGMAFADTIVAETDATVVIVDRYDRPGGHWTVAYPFVRLHQPSAGYGVNSLPLGDDAVDQVGLNAGLLELASADEVCAYYRRVLEHVLLPTGRVTYLSRHEHVDEGRCRSLVTGDEVRISVRKIVDSTYQNVTVPAMRAPGYEIARGVTCVPPNALVEQEAPAERYVVVGGGKTGVDTCLWLLDRGVDPANISWIVPRDAWLADRALTQPGPRFADTITPVFMAMLGAIGEAADIEDLFARFEECGRLLRLDPEVQPTMFRCATVSRAELDQLRRIEDVVRLGRVQRIEHDRIVLDGGEVPTTPQTAHIDCTADGLARRPVVPVFDGEQITLQSVRSCQQVFSAALIAHVEAAYRDESVKNHLCEPVQHPDHPLDVFRTMVDDARNARRWADEPELEEWLHASRLDWLRRLGPQLPDDPEERAALVEQMRPVLEATNAKLEALLAASAAPA